MSGSRSKGSKGKPPTAFTRLQQQLQVVDLLIEVRDARIPISSKHPKSHELFGNKPRLIILSKQDLADPVEVEHWRKQLTAEGVSAMALSFKLNKGKEKVIAEALRLTEDKRQSIERKGLLPRPMRLCVVGLPNVGKSTFINWLIGQKKAKTGDTPGITRGTQWVRVHPQLELLDTPGILPPVAFGKAVTIKLALCNILPQSNYDIEEVAEEGLSIVTRLKDDALKNYGIDLVETPPTLENLAKARSCVGTGGKPDTRRAAAIFLNDFRAGKLGNLVLDEQ